MSRNTVHACFWLCSYAIVGWIVISVFKGIVGDPLRHYLDSGHNNAIIAASMLLSILFHVLVGFTFFRLVKRIAVEDNPDIRGRIRLLREYNNTWDEDIAHCREIMRNGSKSFFLASLLLPDWMRGASLALYSFCREADDEVDEVRPLPPTSIEDTPRSPIIASARAVRLRRRRPPASAPGPPARITAPHPLRPAPAAGRRAGDGGGPAGPARGPSSQRLRGLPRPGTPPPFHPPPLLKPTRPSAWPAWRAAMAGQVGRDPLLARCGRGGWRGGIGLGMGGRGRGGAGKGGEKAPFHPGSGHRPSLNHPAHAPALPPFPQNPVDRCFSATVRAFEVPPPPTFLFYASFFCASPPAPPPLDRKER
jgi:hypothetical protein